MTIFRKPGATDVELSGRLMPENQPHQQPLPDLVRQLEEIQHRLGGPGEKPGDVERCRLLAHDLRNRIMVWSIAHHDQHDMSDLCPADNLLQTSINAAKMAHQHIDQSVSTITVDGMTMKPKR